MNKKSVLGLVALIVVIAAAGGGFALYKKRSAESANLSRQNMEAALENMKARAENPDQKPFKDKNVADLSAKLSATNAAAERIKTVQAGIVYFDLDNGKSWAAEQYNELASELLNVLGETPKTPEEKRLHIMSFQLAKRVLPHVTSIDVIKKLDTLLVKPHADPYEAALYIDLSSLPQETPSHFVDLQSKCLMSKDTGVAQSCIQVIEQTRNDEVRAKLAKTLLAKWNSLKEPLKPYAVKTLISQHAFFEKEASGLLESTSQKDGEIWTDVFVYGVSELKQVDKYRSKLEALAKSAEAVSIRQRAQEILK